MAVGARRHLRGVGHSQHLHAGGKPAQPHPDGIGHRAADTCQIALEGLEVPEENMLGAPGAGYRIALAYLENGRIGVAAQAVGVARAAYEAALRYAQERQTMGKPIIALPSTSGKGTSKIVPYIKTGGGVVTTRANVHYMVTEYGVANLYGLNMRQRAKALIDIAHPNHREELEKAAFERFKSYQFESTQY